VRWWEDGRGGRLGVGRRGREESDAVEGRIFENPARCGPHEGRDLYPREHHRDLRLWEPLGVELVLAPSEEEMYPPGFQTRVVVEDVARPLEGAARPGHFVGVATIVCKLFNIFQPDRAYFGQKDAQQAVVIRRMARDLDFDLEIVVCPTVREPDGLARSSRNVYLSPEERRAATVLFRALSAAQAAWQAGERDGERLRQHMRAVLASEPLARPDYVSIADPDTLVELDQVGERALASLAVRIGATRLIDNLILE